MRSMECVPAHVKRFCSLFFIRCYHRWIEIEKDLTKPFICIFEPLKLRKGREKNTLTSAIIRWYFQNAHNFSWWCVFDNGTTMRRCTRQWVSRRKCVKYETQIFPVHFTWNVFSLNVRGWSLECIVYFMAVMHHSQVARSHSSERTGDEKLLWLMNMCNVARHSILHIHQSKCTFCYRLLHSKLIKMVALRWAEIFA